MNNILHLRGDFEQGKASGRPGPANLPKNGYVTIEHIDNLKRELIELKQFWSSETYLSGALISVHYIDIIAKSRRIKSLLSKGGKKPNDTMVGAKFSDGKPKHIITHYVPIDFIDDTINKLSIVTKIITILFDGNINQSQLEIINKKDTKWKNKEISKSVFAQTVVDCYYVEKFNIPSNDDNESDNVIVNLYKTDESIEKVLQKIGIDVLSTRIMGETVLLFPDQIELLKSKAPYLIAMITSDISKIEPINKQEVSIEGQMIIPNPKNEPTIGVIDTLFDGRVYFSKWVDNHTLIPEEIIDFEDYEHGTMVDSIIVDGPNINPELDDGCGRFKVRHFGVTKATEMSSFSILRKINEIISNNKDIRVWNLSLGSQLEINPNFISPEASILDKIQYDNNVIFVVAGTNIPKGSTKKNMKIGAPADSINSLVVNAVNINGRSASYSRRGLVLSFFNKPDLSYFGGDKDKKMKVCGSTGSYLVTGTSFAAPWISRKMSYLIDVLNISRECAKALLIDAASKWNDGTNMESSSLIGYGIVPQKINDIIFTPEDEIKFIIDGISEKYDTYNYNIPVPMHNGKYPFVAKAVMCYFPNCSRNQGVDYTNTELDIGFGRIGDDGKIKTINENHQNDDGWYTYEGNARKNHRKWDNVKYIVQTPTALRKDKDSYKKNKMWGISVKTKERLDNNDGADVKFGVVITLRELHKVNRIETFIKSCRLNRWFVDPINIEERLDIYNTSEEEITLE